MPTRGRQQFAREAVACFLAQEYPFKELLILDDLDEPSFPNGLTDIHQIEGWETSNAAISYRALNIRYSIPQKRNMLCAEANGEILMHFDSDDHSAPGRMTDQVERLEKSGKALTGYSSLLFVDELGNWYRYKSRRAPYALGTSLAFTKAWWAAHPFKENHPVGSDNQMVYAAIAADSYCFAEGGDMMYARIHADNTSKKIIIPDAYVPVETCLRPT